MRIAIYDDLHIETDGKQAFELVDADVCVLAGDICVATHLPPHKTDADSRGHRKACQRFFQRVSDKYNHVIYVMGNHEHYRGVFEQTPVLLRNFLSQWPNITLLEKEGFAFRDIYFFGATLWTSCNNNNPLTCLALKDYLNDFHVIKRDGGATWSPEMSYLDHCEALDALKLHMDVAQELKDKGEIRHMVVVTHHAPSHISLDERFRHEVQGNFGYFSDLDMIASTPPIKLWFHGHLHVARDYYIEDTRVVCNPRGYPGENQWGSTGFNARKVVEI